MEKGISLWEDFSFISSVVEGYRFQKLAPEMKWKEIKNVPQSVKMLSQKKTENKYHCGWYVVQLSTQHNPFWSSLDLTWLGNKGINSTNPILFKGRPLLCNRPVETICKRRLTIGKEKKIDGIHAKGASSPPTNPFHILTIHRGPFPACPNIDFSSEITMRSKRVESFGLCG